MPIYEFFCSDCNTIFNFFSRSINTEKRPSCPRCGRAELEKKMSTFAITGKAEENGDDPLKNLDEAKMERAFEEIMKDAGNIDEDDPRHMAALMRRFSDTTGLALGDKMEEAIARLEAGDDPDVVEAEMGDIMDDDEPFSIENIKRKARSNFVPPEHDETLYEL